MKYEIHKTLVLSSSHIDQITSEILKELDLLTSSFSYLIYVDEPCYNLPNLEPILNVAKEQDCLYVMLDQDGPIIDKLLVYDW